jgi:hypothetical protein
VATASARIAAISDAGRKKRVRVAAMESRPYYERVANCCDRR